MQGVADILSIFDWRYQKRGSKTPNLRIFGEKPKNILSAFGWRYQKRGFSPPFSALHPHSEFTDSLILNSPTPPP